MTPRLNWSALEELWYRYRVARRARSLHARLADAITCTAPDQPAFLACAVMCRGEDSYLVEWLEFHRMMGVEHFFIYDNGTEASTKALLGPYIAERLVTYIPFPDLDWPGIRKHWTDYGRPSIQELAYGHCLAQYRRHYRLLLRIDVDEFVYPAEERHATLVDVLRELDIDRIMGIEIPMRDFGSSSHQRRPDGLVIESYTKAAAGHRNHKSIGNAGFIASELISNPHRFRYSLRARLAGAVKIHSEAASALFRLNHYITKSMEEYIRKGEINAAGYLSGKETYRNFVGINLYANQVEHLEILRFVPELRRRLVERGG